MVNKGGCKVGKKAPEGTPKGGCKEGLKAPKKKKLVVVGPVDTMVATKKTKVQQPAQKAKVIAAKPRVAKVAKVVTMPKKKKKIVVKKKEEPKPSIGKKLTGLSKEEMNKLSPLELFGMLPVSVAKKVLTPKVTGVKVGKSKISNITEEDLQIWELAPEDEDSNWWDSALYHEDFTGIMTPTQGKWYIKARLKGFDDLSRKDQDKWEGLEEKIMMGVSSEVQKHHTKMFREWKKKNKGMTGTLTEFKKSFEKYYN